MDDLDKYYFKKKKEMGLENVVTLVCEDQLKTKKDIDNYLESLALMNKFIKQNVEDDVKELKEKYNKLIEKYKNNAAYLDNPNTPLETRLKYTDKYNELIKSIDCLLMRFKLKGVKLTQEEILNGFKVDLGAWEQEAVTVEECEQLKIG